MSDLKAVLGKLATDFAEAAVAAIQHASLDDIAGIARSRAPSRASALPSPAARSAPPARRGRSRRTAADIGKVTNEIAALLAKHKGGLRAEQIRAELGVPKNELPRPIAEGLASGKFKKRGEKRATTYFVGGGAATKAAKPKAKRFAKGKAGAKRKQAVRKPVATTAKAAKTNRRRDAATKPAKANGAPSAATSAS